MRTSATTPTDFPWVRHDGASAMTFPIDQQNRMSARERLFDRDGVPRSALVSGLPLRTAIPSAGKKSGVTQRQSTARICSTRPDGAAA
jgi:hypothetical protein